MKNLVLLFSVIVTLSSCNLYKPAMMNAPVLEEKGEINLGVSTGNGTDVTASYAITDYLAVSSRFTTNANLTYEVTTFDTTQKFTAKNYNYELALGYFNAKNEGYNISFFGGYAMGETGTLDDNFLLFSEDFAIGADFSSFFVQGAAFANLDKQNHVGLVVRVNAIEYSNFRYSDFFANEDFTSSIDFSDKTQTVGQAGLQYNYKGQKFGFMSQLQYAFTNSNDDYFTVRGFGIHVGAYFRLNEIFKKVD